jgi:hypothetical protein
LYSPDFIGGDSVAEFSDQGVPLSPASGFTQGHISGPQGMAVDQRGNVWIANHVGSSMTEYLGGDPNNNRVFTGNGISKPFAIASTRRATSGSPTTRSPRCRVV